MHKLLISASIIALMSSVGAAMAADLRVESQPEVASGGLYIGAFGGFASGAFGGVSSYAWDHDWSNNGATDYESKEEWWSDGALTTGWNVGVVAGTSVAPNVRVEGELSYMDIGTDSKMSWSCENLDNNACENDDYDLSATQHNASSLNAVFGLANVWVDLAPDSAFDPYVGGGVGIARLQGGFAAYIDDNSTANDVENAYIDQTFDQIAPAAQLGAGVAFKLNDNLSIDVGYRFKAIFNATANVSTDYEDENNASNDVADYTTNNTTTFGIHTLNAGLRVTY